MCEVYCVNDTSGTLLKSIKSHHKLLEANPENWNNHPSPQTRKTELIGQPLGQSSVLSTMRTRSWGVPPAPVVRDPLGCVLRAAQAGQSSLGQPSVLIWMTIPTNRSVRMEAALPWELLQMCPSE